MKIAICDSDTCIARYLNDLKAGQDVSAEIEAIAADRNKVMDV